MSASVNWNEDLGNNAKTFLQNIERAKANGIPENKLLVEVSGSHNVNCSEKLFIPHISKNKLVSWVFTITSSARFGPWCQLKHVFTLDPNLPEFSITNVSIIDRPVHTLHTGCQEWQNNLNEPSPEFKVTIQFVSSCYGNFYQRVVFGFGASPKIVRNLGVMVGPETSLVKQLSYKRPCSEDNELNWLKKYELITYDGQVQIGPAQSLYQLPASMKPALEFGSFDHLDDTLTTENYRDRLHTILFIEEYERRKQLTRLNLNCDDLLQCASTSVDLVERMSIQLAINPHILEDTNNLINRSSRAIIKLVPSGKNLPKLYEVIVKAIHKDSIVLLVSATLHDILKQAKSPVPANICFRFVDTYKYMHQAIDSIHLNCVFPRNPGGLSLELEVESHPFLNKPQATALSHILDPRPKPPLLIFGPFGTGKTRTIVEAVKELCRLHSGNPAENLRILICTHSNSAADHYIVEYLHPFVMSSELGSGLCTPLRICWEDRFLTTVSTTVLKYSFISKDSGKFAVPSKDVLDKYRVVVTTLVTADVLIGLGLPDGYFSHVFIDEAAQAMEAETLIPLRLSTPSTRVVLAGDHLQLGAIVHSPIARRLALGRSLLVRLYDLYPGTSNCKLLLLENYRAYQDIVDIPSKLFYEGTLIAHKTKSPLTEYPVHFYGVLGKETRAPDIPSYYNMAEAAEISERVEQLVDKWTEEWDEEINLEHICVLSPYTAQVREIRQLLRKKRLGQVRVESVNNVQGLEFDAIFISTVHTSYSMTAETLDRHDLGFLSDPRLLNTAVTRAKYHLVFVGDPSALCGAGDCKVCWRTILSKCNDNGTFHYRLPFDKVMEYTRIGNPNQHVITNGAVSVANKPIHDPTQGLTGTPIATSGHQSVAQPVVVDAGAGVFVTSNGPGPTYQPGPPMNQQRPGVVPRMPTPLFHARPQLRAVIDPLGVTRIFSFVGPYPTGQVRMYSGQPRPLVQPSPFNGNQRLPYAPVYNQGSVLTPPHVQSPGPPLAQVCFVGPQTGPVPGYNLNHIPSQQPPWQIPNQPSSQTFGTPRTESPVAHQVGNQANLSSPTPSDSPTSRTSNSPSFGVATNSLRGTTSIPSQARMSGPKPSDSPPSRANNSPAFDMSTNSLRGTASIPSQSSGQTSSSLGRASLAQEQCKESNSQDHVGTSGYTIEFLVQALMQSIQNRRRMLNEENSWLAALCEERTLIPKEVTESILKQLQLVGVEIESVSQQLDVHELLARQLDISCTDSSTSTESGDNNFTSDQLANEMRRVSLDCDEEVQRLLQSPFSVNDGSESENKEFEDSDTEEWFLARREDPLVQEYIKAFESLVETFSSDRNEDQSNFYQENPDDGSFGESGSSNWLLEPSNGGLYIGNSIHQEYEDEDIVFASLLNNDLVLCTMEVNNQNSGVAKVIASDVKAMYMGGSVNEIRNFDAIFCQDIVIPTRVDMNRAFHGDIVAVEVDDKTSLQPRGRVVFIFKNVHPRECICTVDAHDSNVMIPIDKNNPNIFVMQSKDHRGVKGVAVFTIREGEAKCREFVTETTGCLFLVRVLEWGANYRQPLGIVRKCFKEVSDMNSAVLVFAAEYSIRLNQPDGAMTEVGNIFSDSYRVPETEWLSRAYRYDNAFTLDCGGSPSMELDDAISFEKEKGGAYSVGVHIADVSYFVRKDSHIDKAAFAQGCSVYPDKHNGTAINMLPPLLSRNLCSLLPKQDRLAVSVIFRLDKDGQVIKPPDIHRSVVASCCSLTFKECDDILDGKSSKKLPGDLEKNIRILENLTRKIALRQIRLGCVSGAVTFIQSPQSRSSQIVEQLMIMANATVAQRLLLSAKTKYLTPLRRQLPPRYHLSDSLSEWCAENDVLPKGTLSLQRLTDSNSQKNDKSDVMVDLSCLGHISTAVNAQDLAQMTEALLKFENSPVMSDARSRFCGIQERSQYIVSSLSHGVQLKHFTLGLECYTHFTSPLRRYFDLVVHRCLLALIYDKPPPYNLKELQDICLQCQMTSARATAFERSCMSTSLANSLRTAQQSHVANVERVFSDRFTLHCKTDDDCKPFYRVVKVHELGTSKAEFLEKDQDLVLTWNKRDVHCSAPSATKPHSPANQSEAQSNRYLVKIQAPNWLSFISEVIRGSIKRINKSWKKVNSSSHAIQPSSSVSDDTRQFTTTESTSSFTAQFVAGARVNVVLGSEMRRGIRQPLIWGVELSSCRFFCISHRHDPESTFCLPLTSPALPSYANVQEYQRVMIPLIEAESAASVCCCKAISRLCRVGFSWTIHGSLARANLMLSKALYESQDVKVSVGDYLCIHSETPSLKKITDQSSSKICTLLHARAIQLSEHLDQVVLSIESTEPSSSFSLDHQNYTVELIPQSSRYKHMLDAVKSLGQAPEILRSIVLHQDLLFTPAKLDVSLLRYFPLDIDQAEAVKSALNSPFTVIHGSPGTGKTWTAVAITCHFITNNWQTRRGQVLLCAPTNKALDVIAKMLVKIPSVNVLRVYSRDEECDDSFTVIEECKPMALHLRLRKPENPHANALRMCLVEIDQISQRIEQSELQERESLQKKLMNRKQKLDAILDAAEGHEFKQTSSHVILCTCVEAGSPRVRKFTQVSQCIVDECNMCLDAELLVPLVFASQQCDNMVWIGDPKQLVPVLHSKNATKYGLGRSLFESLVEQHAGKKYECRLLRMQFRMHPSLRVFSSEYFYKDKPVFDAPQVSNSTVHMEGFWPNSQEEHHVFCHVTGEELVFDDQDADRCNPTEIEKIVAVVNHIESFGFNGQHICIISPFVTQRKRIQDALTDQDIQLMSPQESQGSEHPFVIFSTVRSSSNLLQPWKIGCLGDGHQMNVVLTRARLGLIIIGDKQFLERIPPWKTLLSEYNSIGCVVDGASWP